jgi:hypothetical protein
MVDSSHQAGRGATSKLQAAKVRERRVSPDQRSSGR